MAVNALYTAWVNSILASLVANTHQAHLVSAAYVPSPDTHSVVADIPVASIIATAPINGARVDQGRFLCDDIVWANVAATTTAIESIVITNSVTGALVAYLQNVSGLKVAPNGNDAILQFEVDCGVFGI